jgi:hypothetical protein
MWGDQIVRQIVKWSNSQTGILKDRQMDGWTNRHTFVQLVKWSDSQSDMVTDTQTDRWTDIDGYRDGWRKRHIDRWTFGRIYRQTYIQTGGQMGRWMDR